MSYSKVIIILALISLAVAPPKGGGGGGAGGGGSACAVVQTGAVTCSSNCYLCNNGTCQDCCFNYYLQSNTCIQCSDANCLSCSSTRCVQCNTNYGPMTANPAICSLCNKTSAFNCRTVNSCSNSSCVDCSSFGLNNIGQCLTCSQLYRNCDTCNNSQCFSCLSGFYLNSSADYQQCTRCYIAFCASCLQSQICQNCISGYYVTPNGTACKQCVLPCVACLSDTSCTACDTSLLYTLVNSSCLVCNSSMAGCLKCTSIINSNNVTCSLCFDGYYLSGSACMSCQSPCLKCTTSATQCLSCINSSFIYDSANNLCPTCPELFPNCTDCTISTCLRCSEGFYASGGSCVICNTTYSGCDTCNSIKCFTCLTDFVMLTNLTCIYSVCNSPCQRCGVSATTCISCISEHYLSGTSCLPCILPCKTCSSSAYCLTCLPEHEYSSGVCIACVAGQMYNPFSLRCQACPPNCLYCSWWDGCYNCTSPLFSVVDKRCKDICGDTYVAQLDCDAVIGVANDGCTDSCTIESSYNCTKVLNTTIINGVSIPVNNSHCSYIGSVKVSIVSAIQSIFANNLKLGFQINPYLSGMPTSADNQSYLKSIFILSPLDTLASYQISVDQKQRVVYFSIDHTNDISQVIPTLSINFNTLASSSTMFQYMTTTTYPFQQINQILVSGRLGEPEEESLLSFAKIVYNLSTALTLCSIFIMVFGLFGKELVGLDQIIICQHVFFLLVFYKGKLTLPLIALSGLKYSTGLHFEDNMIAMNQNQSYILGFDSSSFLYNFNFNLAAYSLPLIISFFILLYKLRYKHLPAWRDLAQQLYEVLIGETILYLVIFNLGPLIVYSYLFYTSSPKSIEYYDSAAIALAVAMTLFAFFNFFFKPEIVGMFRSAFKTQNDERSTRKSNSLQEFQKCISKRFCEQNLKSFYTKITINFYFVYICYLAIFILLTIFSPFDPIYIILGVQIIMLAIVVFTRPHYNPFQKLRALLTWIIMLIGTATVAIKPKTFTLPMLFLILLALHIVGSILILINSIWQQIKRKCNNRTEVVKKLLKQGQVDGQKKALRQLILRYQNLDLHKTSLNDEVQKIQLNFKESFVRQYDKLAVGTPKGSVKDEEKIQFEQQIIEEQHQHLRYQKGLQFFQKYANTIDLQLIKEYSGIQDDRDE